MGEEGSWELGFGGRRELGVRIWGKKGSFLMTPYSTLFPTRNTGTKYATELEMSALSFPPPPHLPIPPPSFPLGTRNSELATLSPTSPSPHPPTPFPTQHSALYTQHSVPTQHSALYTQHSVPTQHSALYTQHLEKHSALYTQHSIKERLLEWGKLGEIEGFDQVEGESVLTERSRHCCA
uniref:Uncharacterized protein n=1 Tax=Desertifilum tharense IPPAS B-1220 TaxID=1781255 RepID=A0ACD5H088_9CYAN